MAYEAKRLPRYPVPVAHLGRLAVDVSEQGAGLGARLLIRAMEVVRQVSNAIGVNGLEVRAKNPSGKAFYEHFGFVAMQDDELHLSISLKSIRRALDLT